MAGLAGLTDVPYGGNGPEKKTKKERQERVWWEGDKRKLATRAEEHTQLTWAWKRRGEESPGGGVAGERYEKGTREAGSYLLKLIADLLLVVGGAGLPIRRGVRSTHRSDLPLLHALNGYFARRADC